MIKLALAMIVKGVDEEADVFARCLQNVSPHVDGIFITITHTKGEKPSQKVIDLARLYNANISYFEWVKDFSKARNYNFSQVTKEYTHILWADADDVFRGLDKLKETIEENINVDVFSLFYLYDFDEYKQPTVVHQKSQVVKHNGCVEWAGELHEDFRETRNLRRMFVKDIERMHLTTDERVKTARERNVDVAQHGVEEKPDDPRSYWNLGNSLFGAGRHEESREALEKFLKLSTSDDEKYLARLRLSSIDEVLGKGVEALDNARYAIGIKPEYPDAYHHIGSLYYNMGNFQKARDNFLLGLVKRPPYYSIIVYNPRDYDFNPLMMLAKTYFNLSQPDQALTCLEGCLKIQPDNEGIKRTIKEMKKEKKVYDKAIKTFAKLKDIKNKQKLKAELDKLPTEIQQDPRISLLRNTNFVKKKSSGRDIVYYCGLTTHEWNPQILKEKGLGGSEEAVIHLSKQWAKLGWNVTVYNNCGHKEQKFDGVTYKPWWTWNYRDKQDIVILWRSPKAADYKINADKVIVDLHDVVGTGEFTHERLEHIDRVMVKTHFHRSLFPKIPDEKIAVIPNGMDFGLFDQKATKDQYLIVNTSSPERSLDVLPKLFREVKKRVPQAKCKWAYGWGIYDTVHQEDAIRMQWKADTIKAMEDAGVENMGRVTQKEAAKLYLEANVLGYPTEFAEIDCITVKKAQACGALPITTDFGAMPESVAYGIKVHSEKTKDNWIKDFQYHFGLEDEKAQKEWVDAVVKQLQTPIGERSEMKEWTKRFNWDIISKQWNEILNE